jgi:hypothetical protein
MAVDQTKLTTLTGLILSAGVSKIISGFTTETPGHADYINHVLQQLANNDVTLEQDAADVIRNIRINIIDLAIEVETLKGATVNGVTANIFVETFINLNDVTLLRGTHDVAGQKVYLK